MLKWTLVSIPNNLTKKLSPTGNCLQRKISCLYIFSKKSHWVYKLYLRAGPSSSSRQPTQNKFNGIFRDFFSDIILGMFQTLPGFYLCIMVLDFFKRRFACVFISYAFSLFLFFLICFSLPVYFLEREKERRHEIEWIGK